MGCTRLIVVASVLLLLCSHSSGQSLKPTVQKVSILDLLAESPELKAKLDARLKEGRAGKTVAATTVRNSRRGFRLPSRRGSSQAATAKASTTSVVSTRRPGGRREPKVLSTSLSSAKQEVSNSGRQRNARFGGSRFRSRARATTPATAIDEEEAAPSPPIDIEGAAVIDATSALTTQRPRIRNARLPPGLRRRSRVTTRTTTTSTVSTPVISVVPPIDHIDDKGEVELTTSTTTAKPSRRNGRRFPTLRRRS